MTKEDEATGNIKPPANKQVVLRNEARKIQLPLGQEEKSPVQRALEVALHELTSLDGLHVTDVPGIEYTWEIDTKDAAKLIENALSLTLEEDKKRFRYVIDRNFALTSEIQKNLLEFIQRVSANDGKKTPEEVKILPEISRLLMDRIGQTE